MKANYPNSKQGIEYGCKSQMVVLPPTFGSLMQAEKWLLYQ